MVDMSNVWQSGGTVSLVLDISNRKETMDKVTVIVESFYSDETNGSQSIRLELWLGYSEDDNETESILQDGAGRDTRQIPNATNTPNPFGFDRKKDEKK